MPMPRNVLIALLVVSAALFAVGVAVERSQPGHSESREATERATAAAASAAGEATNDGDAAAEGEERHAAEGTASEAAAAETSSEKVFGINPESTGLVVAAVVASLLLAFGVWRFPRAWQLLLLVALVCLAFAIFDIREAVHQAGEERAGLTVIAAIVAALHLGASGVASRMVRDAPVPPVAT